MEKTVIKKLSKLVTVKYGSYKWFTLDLTALAKQSGK